jgi:transcriptional regulator with XRE-family HTH domain
VVVTRENPILNESHFGRLARAARIAAGYPTTLAGAQALTRFGLNISDRSLAALERGELKPTVAMLAGLTTVYRPPGRMAYFIPSMRQDIQDYLTEDRRQ